MLKMHIMYSNTKFYYHNNNEEKEVNLKIIATVFANKFVGNDFNNSIKKLPADCSTLDYSSPSILFLFEPENAPKGEAIIDHLAKQNEIQLILSKPNFFVILISSNKSRDTIKSELSSYNWLSYPTSNSDNNNKGTSPNNFLSYSFLTKDEIKNEKSFNSYIELIKIFNKCSLFDPTGIRKYLQFRLYNKHGDNYNGPYHALVADDDYETAQKHAYFLYRLGYSVTIVNSWRELIHMKEYYLDNFSKLLVDEILKFDDHSEEYVTNYKDKSGIARGSIFIEKLDIAKEKTLLITGGVKNETINSLQKPIVDKFDLSKRYSELNKQSIVVSHNYSRFSDNQSHQIVVKSIREIYKNTISNLNTENKDSIFFQIIHYDAYQIIKGRDGILALQSINELQKSEVNQICKYYPDKVSNLWEDRYDEINSMVTISFPELNSNSKKTVNSKKEKTNKKINILSLHKRHILLREIYKIMNESALHSELLSNIKFKVLTTQKEIYSSIDKHDRWKLFRLKTRLFTNKHLSSIPKLFISWLILIIVFGLIYILIGTNCSNVPVHKSTFSIVTKSIVYSFAGGFGFAGFTGLDICCTHHQHIFIVLSLLHSIISFILFLFLIDYFIQKLKEF